MTNLLAIDTTTDLCSAALATDGGWFEDTRLAPRLHNREVLATIDNVVDAAALDKNAIDIIAFGGGPGSFTGVRIGSAVAQGLAFGIDARVVVVPSSAVAAQTARRLADSRGIFTICRQSRPGWQYLSRYELSDFGVRCLQFDRLVSADVSGADETPSDGVIHCDRFAVSARVVAQLALQQAEQAVAPALAVPFYVEGDSPWQASPKRLEANP